jgi:hypothetical protein
MMVALRAGPERKGARPLLERLVSGIDLIGGDGGGAPQARARYALAGYNRQGRSSRQFRRAPVATC